MELDLNKIKGSFPVQESMRVIENLLVEFRYGSLGYGRFYIGADMGTICT